MNTLVPDETILGLLAAHTQHGYQLLETFNDPHKLGRVWHLSTSQLYAVLKRLERDGWIEGRQIESENAPPRTEYALTTAGRDYLETWLNDANPSPSIRRIRVEFLSRLYIARLLHRSVAPIIMAQRRACLAERANLVAGLSGEPNNIGHLASDLMIAQLDTVLQWMDRCMLVLTSTQYGD